jgi:hypothetical protein
MSALIPLIASQAYGFLKSQDIQLESSVFHIIWAGPVVILLAVCSAVRILRHR